MSTNPTQHMDRLERLLAQYKRGLMTFGEYVTFVSTETPPATDDGLGWGQPEGLLAPTGDATAVGHGPIDRDAILARRVDSLVDSGAVCCGRPWVAEIETCPRCGLDAGKHPMPSAVRLD